MSYIHRIIRLFYNICSMQSSVQLKLVIKMSLVTLVYHAEGAIYCGESLCTVQRVLVQHLPCGVQRTLNSVHCAWKTVNCALSAVHYAYSAVHYA